MTVHQSGVNSLAVWEGRWGEAEPEEAEEAEPGVKGVAWVTVASGGDDGQLSVVNVRLQFHQPDIGGGVVSARVQSRFAVPLAHAAPLTALQRAGPDLLVSASPDQRVRLWQLTHASHQHGPAPHQHGPTPHQHDPAPHQHGPAPNDSGPAPHQHSPAPNDLGPTPHQHRPALNDLGPAPHQHSLAPHDSSPAPRQLGSAPLDSGPAPGLLGTLFSHVADAAGLAAWPGGGPEGGAWAAVCGQGLQLLRIRGENGE